MDLCQLSRQIFTNKQFLLNFLSDSSHQCHQHFNRCSDCGVFLEENLSEALSDCDVQEAFSLSYQEALCDIEGTLIQRIAKTPKYNYSPVGLYRSVTRIFMVEKMALPSAAGNVDEMRTIPQEVLHEAGFKDEFAIICRRYAQGYEIYIQGHKVMQLRLCFYKEEQQLLQVDISEQLPEKLVSEDSIKGWTHIAIEEK